MPRNNQDTIWKYLRSLEKLSDILLNDFNQSDEEINQQIIILKSYIKKKDFSKYVETSVETFCIKKWETTIKEVINRLLAKIKNRKTRGSEFSETKFQLKKLKEDINIEDYEIEKYENIYEEDLKKSYATQIREKIENEKYSKKNFWKGILVGALIGFILGFFTNLLYDLIKPWLI